MYSPLYIWSVVLSTYFISLKQFLNVMTGLLSAKLSEKTRATMEVYIFLAKMVSE